MLVVKPFQRIHNRKCHSIVLRHACHVICEYIKNAIQHQSVIGSLCDTLGKAHIQQRIQAGCTRTFIRIGLQVSTVRVDREVMLVTEQFFTKSLQGYEVTPFATLLLHKLLQLISHFLLPFCQGVNNGLNIFYCDLVANIRDLLATLLKGSHTHTLADDMTQRLGTLAQLVEGHNGGNRHFHGIAAKIDFLDLLFPRLHFCFGICLFRELKNNPSIERQFCLASAQTVIDSLAAGTKSLPRISRAHLLPEHEVRQATSAISCIIHRTQFTDAVVACLVHMLVHGVVMEFIEVLDILLQRPDNLRQLPQLVCSHLIDNKLAAVAIYKLLGGVDKVLQSLHEVRRQIGIALIHIS